MTACRWGYHHQRGGRQGVLDDSAWDAKLAHRVSLRDVFYGRGQHQAYKATLRGRARAPCAACLPTQAITFEERESAEWIGDFRRLQHESRHRQGACLMATGT